jgi:hypothetical protein
MPRQRRPTRTAAANVLPEPAKGSSTNPPGGENASTSGMMTLTAFSVGWTTFPVYSQGCTSSSRCTGLVARVGRDAALCLAGTGRVGIREDGPALRAPRPEHLAIYANKLSVTAASGVGTNTAQGSAGDRLSCSAG